jgi:hypothetical protein
MARPPTYREALDATAQAYSMVNRILQIPRLPAAAREQLELLRSRLARLLNRDDERRRRPPMI